MTVRASTLRFAWPMAFAPAPSPCMWTPRRISTRPAAIGSAIAYRTPDGVVIRAVATG